MESLPLPSAGSSFQQQWQGGSVWVAVVCVHHSASLGAGSPGGNGPAQGQVTRHLEWLYWNLLGSCSAMLAMKSREVVFLRRTSGKPNPSTLFLKV